MSFAIASSLIKVILFDSSCLKLKRNRRTDRRTDEWTVRHTGWLENESEGKLKSGVISLLLLAITLDLELECSGSNYHGNVILKFSYIVYLFHFYRTLCL